MSVLLLVIAVLVLDFTLFGIFSDDNFVLQSLVSKQPKYYETSRHEFQQALARI